MAGRVRNAMTVVCVAVCLALLALWVRSYRTADRIQGPLCFQRSVLLGAKQGRAVSGVFRLSLFSGVAAGNLMPWEDGGENRDFSQWNHLSFATGDEMSFPIGDARQHDAALGFGLLQRPAYMVTRSTFETPPGGTIYISGAASAGLDGWAISVPFWFLVLLTASAAVAMQMKRPWRFSTRSFLIAVTVLAVVLGLVAKFDRAPPNWRLDMPVPLDDV